MQAYQPERVAAATKSNTPIWAPLAQHPFLTGGAALSLLVMGTIFVNAAWYQPGKHPSPLFATRSLETVKPIEKDPVVAKVKTSVIEESESARNNQELLREVQTALSVRGYYSGQLDGVYGSRTKKAISAFQRDENLQEDGNPSWRLLTQILMSGSAQPSVVPVPKKSHLVQRPKKSSAVETAKKPEAKPVENADGLVAKIQVGLKNSGYDNIVVDGKLGQQTTTAIQSFQLEFGMKITGEPSDRVLKKLEQIGAYTQG